MDLRNSRHILFVFYTTPLTYTLCWRSFASSYDLNVTIQATTRATQLQSGLRSKVLYALIHRAHRALQHLTDYIGRFSFRLYIELPVGNLIYQFALYCMLSGLVYKTFNALPVQDPRVVTVHNAKSDIYLSS